MAKKTAAKTKSTVTSRRQMVPPVNVTKLMDTIGGTRTAAKLGVSTTLLYKAKNENAVNQVVEVAASHALEHLGKSDRPAPFAQQPSPAQSPAGRHGDTLFLVSVSPDKVDMFQKMAAMLGAAIVAA